MEEPSYPKDAKKECCENCCYFDGDASLCRLNPPAGSTWSKIVQPYINWCGQWRQGTIEEERMLQPPSTRKSGTGGV